MTGPASPQGARQGSPHGSSHWMLPAGTLGTERHFGGRTLSCFTQRPRSLRQILDEAVQRAPGRDAVIDAQRRLSWAELDAVAAAWPAACTPPACGRATACS